MNKRKEQITRYLDGSMGEQEKLHFEKNMADDPDLQKETGQMRNFLSAMKADAEPVTEESYFINMLPEFYSRHNKKRKFSFSKLAYSLSTAVAVVLILFVIFRPGSTTKLSTLNDINTKITESELNETLNLYGDQFSLGDLMSSASAKTDSIVSDMVADELDISESVDKAIADKYINTDELLSSIDETQANKLYSQLINEDIIKGTK